MPKYEALSKELKQKIEYEMRADGGQFAFDERNLQRRVKESGDSFWATPFVSDIDKIMHSPYFSR